MKIQWTLRYHRFICGDLLPCRYFSINILETFLETCNNLKKIADKPHSLEIVKKIMKILGIIVRIQYITHTTYKICVNRLFILLVKLLVK